MASTIVSASTVSTALARNAERKRKTSLRSRAPPAAKNAAHFPRV